MEAVQVSCARVGTPTDVAQYLPDGYCAAAREADLPGTANAYVLGGTARPRLSCDPAHLRVAWARAAIASCGEVQYSSDLAVWPLVHFGHEGKVGALTATLKNCYQPDSAARARVILDIDGRDNTKWFPSPRDLFDVCCEMLNRHTSGFRFDPSTTFGAVFFLSMPGKERSAHVIFPFLCFDNIPENVLGKAHPLTDAFNELLEPLGMQGDFSICNSGIRWEFGNKFPSNSNQGRNCVAVPTFLNTPEDVSFYWRDLAVLLDPRVLPTDQCYQNVIKWIIPDIVAANPAKRRTGIVRNFAVDPSTGSAIEARIIQEFPDLAQGGFRRIFQGEGITKLLPGSNFCPFKMEASDDQPAHYHASPKLYIFARPDGTSQVHCGVCEGQSMILPSVFNPDDTLQSSILREFNSKWARIGPLKVMRLPTILDNGEWHETTLLEPRQFETAADSTDPKLKVNGRSFTRAQFWYRSDDCLRFPLGITFDPSFTCAPGFYNSYRGLNVAVQDAPATAWTNTRELIYANICNRDDASFRAVIGFFTHLIQNPGEKPGWGICIYGPQGCGKGLMAQFFAKIVGRRHTCTLDATALESQWNYRMMESLLVIAEEAVAAKEEKTISMLKAYVTEDYLNTRKKYADDRENKTYMRLLMLSNSESPVVIEDHDRRWLVLNARYNLGADQDQAWRQRISAIVEERESLGGCAAFYQHALVADNSDFDSRLPIRTRARWEVRYQLMDEYERYVYHLCTGGDVCGTVFEDGAGIYRYVADQIKCDIADLGSHARQFHVPKALFFTGLQERARHSKNLTESRLWRYLYKVVAEDTWSVQRPVLTNGNRARLVRLPSNDVLQKGFCDTLGQPVEIFTTWRID